jgi:predicted phosphohydrolase
MTHQTPIRDEPEPEQLAERVEAFKAAVIAYPALHQSGMTFISLSVLGGLIDKHLGESENKDG